MNFTDLGLRAALLRSVRERGHVVPTPVQARAIPAILSGRDVTQIACARAGKTAAYALPLLQRLMGARGDTKRAVRAIVLVESRKVALHVASDVRSYGAYLPFHCSASYGGRGLKPRHPAPQPPVDIVVATPASILAELDRRGFELSSVEMLVVDDADRIWERYPHQDIRRVLSYLSPLRQNVLFTASSCTGFELVLESLGHESGCSFGARSQRHQTPSRRRVLTAAFIRRVSGLLPERAAG